MKPTAVGVVGAAFMMFTGWYESKAAGDLTAQKPVEMTVQLGDDKDALVFRPSEIHLETGKLYKLVLVNRSQQKHYFSSQGLASAVYTRKVQVNGADGGALAEVKGAVREIEVYPNGVAEWWFVPVKAGTFKDLRCTIPGHTEGGMVGVVTIE